MITAGQIARAAAPAKTRMAMPAHFEAMIDSPARPRLQIAPALPVVDMAAIEAGRKASQIAKNTADEAQFAKLAQLAEEHQRRKAREAELAMKRERDRRIKLGILTDHRKHHDRVNRLLKIYEQLTGISLELIKGPSRAASLPRCRWIAAWIIKNNCRMSTGEDFSLPRIGKIMGGRNHTTILHGLKKVRQSPKLLADAIELENRVLEMEEKMYGGVNNER